MTFRTPFVLKLVKKYKQSFFNLENISKCKYYFINFLVVINAQLERKQKLATELLAERQRLEIMKKNVFMMEEDITRRCTYSRKVDSLSFKLFFMLLLITF